MQTFQGCHQKQKRGIGFRFIPHPCIRLVIRRSGCFSAEPYPPDNGDIMIIPGSFVNAKNLPRSGSLRRTYGS